MPKMVPPADNLATTRSQLRQKSVAEWKAVLKDKTLSYLNDQASVLKYNEALPYPPIHLRTALVELIAEAKARNETIPRPVAASRILPVSDGIEYERVESGAGKGATVLIPKI